MNKKIASVSPIEFIYVLERGAKNLNEHLNEVNELNIFPVADKDTGSNMMFVYLAIKNKTRRLYGEGNLVERYEVISKTAEESAVGVSGMLFSEIITEFCQKGKTKSEITIDDFVEVYREAYKKMVAIVENPVEGTFVSLVRTLAEESENYKGPKDDLGQYLNYMVQVADREVKASTEKMKELKKAKIVDAGSKGFYYILEGFAQALSEEGFLEKEVNFFNKRVAGIKINPYEDKFMWRSRNIGYKSFIAIAETREAAEIFLNTGAILAILCPPKENLLPEVIVEAIERIDSEEIVILLNDTKLANTIRQLPSYTNKKIIVVTTKTMLNTYYMLKNRLWDSDLNIAQNNQNTTLGVFIVPEDTEFDGVKLKKGEYINVMKNKLVARSNSIEGFRTALRNEFFNNQQNISGLEVYNKEHKILGSEFADKKKNVLGLYLALGKNISSEDRDFIMKNNIPVYHEILDLGQEDSVVDVYIDYRDESLGDIALVTDSTTDIPQEVLEAYNIEIVPLKIKFDGDDFFMNTTEITKNKFWDIVMKEGKTTKPGPGLVHDFKVVYEKLFTKGYKKIITILLAEGLSGTVQNARYSRNLMGDRAKDIKIIDSKLLSFGMSQQIKNAATMLVKKKNEDEIVEVLGKLGRESKMLIVLNDLTTINRGGRVTTHLGKFADLLELKPIIKVENGHGTVIKKAFGHKSAMKFIKNYIAKESKMHELEIVTAYGGGREELAHSEKLRLDIETINNVSLVDRIQMGPLIGTHTGPSYGVGIYPKIKI